MYKQNHITVVIPALNEALSVAMVIADLRALQCENSQPIIDDIIVCDNGSSDETAKVAAEAGARVVYEPRKGYGYACLHALAAIHVTDIVLFIDADYAFYAEQSLSLIEAIENDIDLVIGSRTLGKTEPKALTVAQRFGNRLATTLIHYIWAYPYTDLGPYRAIRWLSLQQLAMNNTGYGWTVEMQVKSLFLGLRVKEVPVDTRVRIGVSKISGTIKGTIKAGVGILGMIAKLRWQQTKLKRQQRLFIRVSRINK